MILNRLTIYSRKTEEIIKQYTFNKIGLNIILGDKKDDSNGAGKTSMVDSIRSLLGTKTPKDFENKTNIINADIMLVLEVEKNSDIIYLSRVISDPKYGYVKYGGDLNFNLDNWTRLKDTDYKKETEEIFIRDDKELEHPSFNSLREYIIRDEKIGFGDICLISGRKAINNYFILNYLFLVDGKAEKDILELKNKQEELNKKLKVIETLSDNIIDIKIKKKKIEEELVELIDITKRLNVNKNIDLSKDDYQELKKEYNDISHKVIKLESIKEQYEENINILKENVEKIKELDDVKKFYAQIIEYFPGKLVKNYGEVLDYYQFMVGSRGKFFGEKIKKVSTMIDKIKLKKCELQEKLNKQLDVLQSTTIVEDINNIIEKVNEKNLELADVKLKIEQYSQKETLKNDINNMKQEIIKQTNIKNEMFSIYKETIKEAINRFNEILKVTYNEGGVLQFEFNNGTNKNDATGRIKIACSILDESSHGKTYMKINMFDLTWLIQRVENDACLQFLIHDGAYVKPDNKQAKYRLFTYVDEYLIKKGKGQYFVTLNLDELESNDIKTLKNANKVIALLGKEKDEDRFMGMKYS
ncbi:DUF2326 domain-containing protein [Clostridium estertheticum]|uniref:DUF2326 domain-containing protein n=1 Tax=Clostridium estertheticum TaxID=238834 RepID=UPI001C0E325A|nr:DUF2326 domain-containing protein [Clostridium estertheticum]MBU3198159.1 DUF2326 domain-containing protein [Clostridium estertheticum]WAG65950.1 DUF2326 domain-containing protein [Clostridium estertheticum]